MTAKPLALLILDGFGDRKDANNNAIAQANTPYLDHLYQTATHTLIEASGTAVGLPKGQMGNSEVGHLNIGAGRVVQQDFTRIDAAITSGAFFENKSLCLAIDLAKNNNKTIHVIGLLSPGGVHSHEKQIHALFELAAQRKAHHIVMHAFLDGRDTPPKSAKASIEALESKFSELGCGKIASLIGRYYAMDRDKRWDRTQAAYDLLVSGKATRHASTAVAGLEQAYDADETDEFVKATAIHKENESVTTIEEGDVVIFMNYRADRARQITQALTEQDFTGFKRHPWPKIANFVMLTQYDAAFTLPVAFAPLKHKNVLGECLANAGLSQLRIAETEKYAHVTFFFNGGVETPFPKETRELIPSPKVATYDLQPEMHADMVADKILEVVSKDSYDVIICNFANPDMVGHTGDLKAAIKAIETIDHCLKSLVTNIIQHGGEVIITADHGNAEKMFDEETGQPHTAHTSEPVPFIYVGRAAQICKTDGALEDIAPTMLYLLGIEKPAEMTGSSLLKLK